MMRRLLLWASAKIQVPFYPVPITMQTAVVFLLGIAYGPRLAMAVDPNRGAGSSNRAESGHRHEERILRIVDRRARPSRRGDDSADQMVAGPGQSFNYGRNRRVHRQRRFVEHQPVRCPSFWMPE